jgi:hypothetical protein
VKQRLNQRELSRNFLTYRRPFSTTHDGRCRTRPPRSSSRSGRGSAKLPPRGRLDRARVRESCYHRLRFVDMSLVFGSGLPGTTIHGILES